MKKVKKIRFTHVVFAVTFAIGISVFSTPAVADDDITVTVPVKLRNVHPDIVECYMVVHLGGLESNQLKKYAKGTTQLDYDPSGNGSFDGDVVVTVDLGQVVAPQNFPTGEKNSGRTSDYAYDDLKAENFTLYRVQFFVVNSNGSRGWMLSPTNENAPGWKKFEGVSTSGLL